MKNIESFVFLLALLVSGCSQEEMLRNGTSASGGRVFTTSFENDESRTYVEDGHLSRWTEGDCISLFDITTLNCQYQFAGDTGDSGGTFFKLSKPEGTGTALSANYAVYPYDKDMTISADGVIALNLPSEQHYAENSYGLGDNTMVAVTKDVDDTFLSFKNVSGCFKLQLYGDDVTVKSITLKGNNGEKIAGKATLAPAYDKAPVVTMADDATTSITLDCGEKGVKIGATAEEATAFWVVLPPTTFEKGITITVRDMNGKLFIQTTDKQLAIERNVVKPMAAVKVKPEIPLVYSTDEEKLEGWSEGLFGGEGTYMMGKLHGDNGYMMTIGNILSEETAIVYLDASRQIREMFVGNTIITLGERTNGTMEVSFIEKDGVETLEHITLNVNSRNVHNSRSSDEHGQQAGTINFVLNAQSIYEGLKEMTEHDVFSKKGAFGYLKAMVNAPTVVANLVKAWGGPDLFGTDSTTEMIGQWLDYAQSAVDFAELGKMFMKPVGVGGPAGACIAAWAGCYAKYLELYDKYISLYFGNSVATIGEITLEGNELNIEVKVPGFESWYNIECGVIVEHKSFPSPRFSNDLATAEVTKDGEYTFTVDMLMDEAYFFRPFLVTKDRTSLWKGFIGDLAGPLVRYGETVQYHTPLREALIKLYEDTNGDKWYKNDNWCSDKTVTEWYGIYKSNDEYRIELPYNATGKIDQSFPEGTTISLSCFSSNINSIKIQGGTSLKSLNCYYCSQLTSIDVSDCTELMDIYYDSKLSTLNVANCKSLKGLHGPIYNSSLSSLNVSGCTALEYLSCVYSQLTSLDVSSCTSLTTLYCWKNRLSSLNVSGCSSLTTLSCDGNQLSSLDVSGCTSLKDLSCYENQLSSLDVSRCALLTTLYCWDNQLTSLNVFGCTSLKKLGCYKNQLSSLDVSGFTSLTDFTCWSNQLSSLNVSGCTSLHTLHCYDNQLFSLKFSDCKAMEIFICYNNNLSSLDVSNFTALRDLRCNDNQITSLNTSGCSSLELFVFKNNPLRTLDVSNCSKLENLPCGEMQLTSLNASGCSSLTSLVCEDNQITSFNVEGCSSLTKLWCKNNKITSVVPDWFSQLQVFSHDQRYSYHTEKINGVWVTYHTDNGYGWWYPGEPDKGKHSPN